MRTKKKKTAWMRHVQKVYRKNKKAGLAAALKKARKTYKKRRH